jgi:hypothetical protein
MEDRRMHQPRTFAARAALLLALGALAALWIAAPTGCFLYKDDPLYCPGMPDNTCVDGAMPCTSSDQCSAPRAVCDLGASNVCVECTPTAAAACLGTKPVCGPDNACRACTKHADCASAACLPDGACGDDANVAYVAPTGMGTACTKINPCKKVDDALKTARPFVKFSGITDEAVTVDNKNVAFLADPGAQLTRTSNGILLEVKGTSRLEIYDLEVTGASGGAGIGISLPAGNTASLTLRRAKITNNTAGGISASGGSLAVSQSIISGNQGGGISVMNGAFDITNCFIYRNGSSTPGTTVGGVALVSTPVNNRLEFNTIVDNEIANSTTSSGGVSCDIAGFSASNNIIARNFVNRMSSAVNANTIGQCAHLSSRVTADVTGLLFVSPEILPLNYRLTSGSSAIDQATTGSSIAVDADGDSRPQGAQKDIGADEYKP